MTCLLKRVRDVFSEAVFQAVRSLYTQTLPPSLPLHLLFVALVMMIHLRVPEQSLSKPRQQAHLYCCSIPREQHTYLIPVSPKEVLRPDVLIRVLDDFIQRRIVLFVLPVLVPQAPGIDAGDDQGGDRDVDCEFAPEICRLNAVVS